MRRTRDQYHSVMAHPRISVITTVYNACSTLEETLKSVVNQEEGLFDYWIIDGGSTDGSLEIIRNYEHQLAGWISEPDKGIYDAMNKGIARSTGDWIYFLGADDTLQPGVLAKIYPHLTDPHKIVFGDVLFDNNQIFHSFLGPRTLMQNTLHHQSAFYHRSLFEDFQYDSSLRIQADYELNIRAYTQRLSTKYVPITIATYALGGISAGATEKSLKEINLVRGRYMKSAWQNSYLTLFLRLYYWQKQFRFWLYGHTV